jgi:hypothetical protein
VGREMEVVEGKGNMMVKIYLTDRSGRLEAA